jgi:hypothetical protein
MEEERALRLRVPEASIKVPYCTAMQQPPSRTLPQGQSPAVSVRRVMYGSARGRKGFSVDFTGMMRSCPTSSLDSHKTRPLLRNEGQHLAAPHPTTEHRRSITVRTVNLKNVLLQIRPHGANLLMERCLLRGVPLVPCTCASKTDLSCRRNGNFTHGSQFAASHEGDRYGCSAFSRKQ